MQALTVLTIFTVVSILAATALGMVRLTMLQLSIFGAPLLLLSVHAVDDSWQTAGILSSVTLSMIAGYLSFRSLIASSAAASRRAEVNTPSPRPPATALVLTFVTSFTVYHFWKTGVPLLADNVELSRLALGESGLFGLPSRMYLYGQVFALGLAVADCASRQQRLSRSRTVWWAILLLLLSRLISGFKSGLIQFDIYILALAVLWMGGFQVTRYIGRILVAVTLAFVFVFAIGTTYNSYRGDALTLKQSIERRLTSESAEPVWIVVNTPSSALGEDRAQIPLDVDYFLNRYFSIGDHEPYGFTRLVSAYWANGSPTADRQYAPVTLSAAGTLWREFGPIAIILGTALGGGLAYLEARARSLRRRPIAFAWMFALSVALMEYVSRGELVYAVLNWTITCLVLAAIAIVGRPAAGQRMHDHNSESRHSASETR